jgi:hypothetical protein
MEKIFILRRKKFGRIDSSWFADSRFSPATVLFHCDDELCWRMCKKEKGERENKLREKKKGEEIKIEIGRFIL